jgi:hypothetical protein
MNIQQIIDFLRSIHGYPVHEVLKAIPSLRKFVHVQGDPLRYIVMTSADAAVLIESLSCKNSVYKEVNHREIEIWMNGCVKKSGTGAYKGWDEKLFSP